MLKTVCDFCGSPAIDKWTNQFKVGAESFRVAVLKVKVARGVRWVEADVCTECLAKCMKGERVDQCQQ